MRRDGATYSHARAKVVRTNHTIRRSRPRAPNPIVVSLDEGEKIRRRQLAHDLLCSSYYNFSQYIPDDDEASALKQVGVEPATSLAELDDEGIKRLKALAEIRGHVRPQTMDEWRLYSLASRLLWQHKTMRVEWATLETLGFGPCRLYSSLSRVEKERVGQWSREHVPPTHEITRWDGRRQYRKSCYVDEKEAQRVTNDHVRRLETHGWNKPREPWWFKREPSQRTKSRSILARTKRLDAWFDDDVDDDDDPFDEDDKCNVEIEAEDDADEGYDFCTDIDRTSIAAAEIALRKCSLM
ncbi:Aste57867_13162 [Aphanomyces stellatus]|uniref:Aste57867_13162 protein n=1 Tax=Aphanomyces stellatus TaxID=120398 RepID=A0A485KXQ6_9STRA|nr:hypothetical protein As57867_013113 [Aphanomyces stellatus]VFT90003.1 Aste57867_13162 [Aphanomyces stellatus]